MSEIHIVITPEDVPSNLYSRISDMSKHDIISAIKTYRPKAAKIPEELGQIGEEFVENILRKEYTVINTAKAGHKGDLIIKYNSSRILIEVKNYTNTIPSTEISKFNRDLTSQIHAGVFISLGSDITGHPDFDFIPEYEGDAGSIPVLFLNSTQPQIIQKSVALLIRYTDCSRALGQMCPSIKHRLLELRNRTEELYVLRANVQNIRDSLDKQLCTLKEKLLIIENMFIYDIDELMNVIRGANAEDVFDVECDARENLKRLFSAYSRTHNTSIQKTGKVIKSGDLVATIYKQYFYIQCGEVTQKINKSFDISQLERELSSPSIANFSDV